MNSIKTNIKRHFILVLFVGVYTFIQAQEYKKEIVAFYNLENLFDTIDTPDVRDTEFTPDSDKKWNSKKYRDKISNMAEVISELGSDHGEGAPAIVGLCEVENEVVVSDLINDPKLKPYNYQVVHYDSPDKRGIDVCLIYQPRVFQVTNSKAIPLFIYDKDSRERIYTRDQLVVSGLFDDESIHFIVNHWPSRYGGAERSAPLRNEAAKLSKSIIDSICTIEKKAKVILMGDLNDDPIDESVTVHLEALGDQKELKKGELYDAMYDLYDTGNGTLAYRGKWNLFDQMILTKSLTGKKKSTYKYESSHIYKVPKMVEQEGKYKGYPLRTYVGSRYFGGYSDHFPVYIILQKKI